MKHKGLYVVLMGLTVVLLVLPALQQHFKWFNLKPLHGVTFATERPKLTVRSFMSGEYQQQEEKYLSENIGFREWMVRCYNQVSWSLFRLPQNKRVVVGKDRWLFSDILTRHHDHQLVYDYGGDNEEVVGLMEASAVMLFQLQEVLKELGVSFFVCLPPSKDRVCEAFMDPRERVYDRPSGEVAIDFFPPLFDSLGINYLNLSEYCMQIKDTVKYSLYLKSSFHWSQQSACYIADTLVRYIESLSGLNMHNLTYGEPYLSKTREPDADLEELMNLLWSVGDDENYYVDVDIDDDTVAVKPRWLVVGDSYYWLWQYGLPLEKMFDAYHYWYYNNTIFNDALHSNVKEVDVVRELLSTDVVMLLYSPTNLYDLSRGFLTNALLALYYEESVVDAKVNKIIQDIKNSPEWYASIEQDAIANGKDVETKLEENARYTMMRSPALYFEEFKEAKVPSCRSSRIQKVSSDLQDPVKEHYREKIFSEETWLNSIREKASNKGISLDKAIEQDIDWMLQNQMQ